MGKLLTAVGAEQGKRDSSANTGLNCPYYLFLFLSWKRNMRYGHAKLTSGKAFVAVTLVPRQFDVQSCTCTKIRMQLG